MRWKCWMRGGGMNEMWRCVVTMCVMVCENVCVLVSSVLFCPSVSQSARRPSPTACRDQTQCLIC
eukprot:4312893-Lingulodinium_polyedra.AAC.1